MSESILDLESGPRRPQLCPKSCIPAEASSRKRAGARPRIHRGTQWVSQPKVRKKRILHPSTSLPEPGPCRTCFKAVWNWSPFVLFLFKDFSYFYKFLSLAYSLWSHMKSPKGTSVQFSLFALFHHVWWLFGPVTPSLVLPTKATHNSAIDRNQGDFYGKGMEQEKITTKGPGKWLVFDKAWK